MGIGNYFKNTVKDNVNVKGWSAWNTIKENGKTIDGIIKDVKVDLTKPVQKTTFADVVKKAGLSENDIIARMKSYYRVALICALLGLGSLCWGFNLLFKSMFLSSLMAFSLSALMFAYAFREHFYYFQLKQRRLDCTVTEWFSSFSLKHKTRNKK